MIYLKLFWAFLKAGMFSFGGAYGAIPVIRDIVMSEGWITEEMFAYFVAVSESTPGPIMVNMATYIGSSQAGFWGAVLATIGVVLPSFVIILVIAAVFNNLIKNKHVQAVLRGVKPCFIGIVLAMGIYMTAVNIFPQAELNSFDGKSLVITIILAVLSFGYQKVKKKDFSPILLITLSAVMGIIVFSF